MDLSLMNRPPKNSSDLEAYEAAAGDGLRRSSFEQLHHNFIPVANYQHHQLKQGPPIASPGHLQHQQQQLFPFTASQWSELEHQALIFKYMVARAPIPPELLIPIRRSLILSANSNFSAGAAAAAWSGFQMGSNPMDAEPGRCRRTDGKKWRCSKPVVVDQKYCERHMHRGRNRSRKAAQAAAAKVMNAQPQPGQNSAAAAAAAFQSPPIPNFEQSPAAEERRVHHPEPDYQSLKSVSQAAAEQQQQQQQQRKTPEALRHFFDEWPRESKEHSSSEFESSMHNNARRNGLIFPPLKLALDDHDTDDPYTNISLASVSGTNFVRSRHPWFTDTPNPLGGPLAEALQNPGSATTSNSLVPNKSQTKPVQAGFNLLDSQLSSRKQQQQQQQQLQSNIVASPTGVLQKFGCFSDCSSSASSPGSIRTDNIPHSLAQVE